MPWGVAATAVWTIVTITIVFQVLKHTIGLRVSPEEEVKGLDITEHGLPTAYGGFAFAYDDTPDGAAVLNPCRPPPRRSRCRRRCRWRWSLPRQMRYPLPPASR